MEYQYQQDQDAITFKEQIQKYFSYWKMFLIFGFLALIIAFLYLRYASVEYKVASTILIKGEKSGMLSELSAFEDLSIVESNNKEVENEIEILKSRPLFEEVIKKFDLHHQYFAKTKYSKRLVELYENKPFVVRFEDSLAKFNAYNLSVEILSNKNFSIEDEEETFEIQGVFGVPVQLPSGTLSLIADSSHIENFIDTTIFIKILSLSDAVEEYKSKVSIGLVNQDANVISLSTTTTNPDKAKDLLNGLVAAYNMDAIRDKNQIYENTAAFIRDRLEIINTELSDIEVGVEEFKTINNLTNVESEAELFLENASESKKELLAANTQLGLNRFMTEYLEKNEEGLLPANLGFADESITFTITQHNEIALKRDEVLKGTTPKNPIVISLNEKLRSLRTSLKQSLKNQKTSLQIKLKDLERQDAAMNAQIASLPKKERQLRDIVRQQNIKETLFLYLLQKREETAISLAATVANAKIIEKAYRSKFPVKPKKRIVILVALVAALFIPILIIFFRDMLDVKIKSRKDIEKSLDIPIVAEIPGTKSKDPFLITASDRSVIAESFRIFESNLKFLLAGEQSGKTVVITSSVTGEGKTFISANIAIALADPLKKVALVGLDLRSPKLLDYLKLPESIGISNFIRDDKLSIDDIKIALPQVENLDIYGSGAVPPNPVALLKSIRFKEFLEQLRLNYDFIIIDTPPINLVADALLVSDYTDVCLFVVRAGLSEKQMLETPKNLQKDSRFQSLALILNDVKLENGKYYGYSYAYGAAKPKPWWKFFSKK